MFWASICTLLKYKHALHSHTLLSHTHTRIQYIFSFCSFLEKAQCESEIKTLACIKKRLQGNIWSSQTAPCLANIQRILLPQKCEYVMYSQVTKQIQQGIHKSSWEAVRHRQLPHASKIYNTPLILASWVVRSVMNKKGCIRLLCSDQRTMRPHQMPPQHLFTYFFAVCPLNIFRHGI